MPQAVIPRVYTELSTRSMLVQENDWGQNIPPFLAVQQDLGLRTGLL